MDLNFFNQSCLADSGIIPSKSFIACSGVILPDLTFLKTSFESCLPKSTKAAPRLAYKARASSSVTPACFNFFGFLSILKNALVFLYLLPK
jgi:hypothetical protein